MVQLLPFYDVANENWALTILPGVTMDYNIDYSNPRSLVSN